MESRYDFRTIEKKWRAEWEKNPINKEDAVKPKFYCLDMFPYPSGSGLHVGHWRGYVLSDVVSRYKVLQGYQVLHPMGWDAFGLPAENYAIKTNTHPRVSTDANIKNAKRQLHEISAIYDWDKEVDTTDPKYYKWTQWIFVQMFKKGLAYEKEMPLNWCPKCKCVLANEEAAGGVHERCGTVVTKKNLRQWMLKITAYADRLLEDLNKLDWSDKVKKMQTDWIGKSYGAEVDFKLTGSDDKITVYTTRPDTLHGCTFMVLAPEYEGLAALTTAEQKDAVEKYCYEASTKSAVDRMTNKEKTGVFTGSYCVNPVNGKEIPIWVADYVLADYGTGAVMCVPAHDERDFDFATKFKLPIIPVILPEGEDEGKPLTEAYTGDGIIVNSGDWNGMKAFDAKKKIPHLMEEKGWGRKTTNYKLRDWVFSRQRYWGEPIPLIHCEHCGTVPVPEDQLPVLLPDVESYQPTETGESPLAHIDEWVNTTCPVCGRPAKRETNTMPQWAGSSWYFLRYMDPHNDKALASKEAIDYWAPVDWYNGGMEHTTLHLLYSRFWHKFLYDIGVVNTKEPYAKRTSHGMILGEGGEKMSKSRGNVVNPNDIVAQYGADTLRLHIMFIGDFEKAVTWSNDAVKGSKRFLDRCWNLMDMCSDSEDYSKKNESIIHKTIKKVGSDIDELKMNTAIAALMTMVNEFYTNGCTRGEVKTLLELLSPFAPHIAEEMWELMGYAKSEGKMAMQMPWPKYDEAKTVDTEREMAVQVNGKLKTTIVVPADSEDSVIIDAACADEKIKRLMEGKQLFKTIVVKNKLVNLIIK